MPGSNVESVLVVPPVTSHPLGPRRVCLSSCGSEGIKVHLGGRGWWLRTTKILHKEVVHRCRKTRETGVHSSSDLDTREGLTDPFGSVPRLLRGERNFRRVRVPLVFTRVNGLKEGTPLQGKGVSVA